MFLLLSFHSTPQIGSFLHNRFQKDGLFIGPCHRKYKELRQRRRSWESSSDGECQIVQEFQGARLVPHFCFLLRQYENLGDLYAVVNSIEQLEKAYIRDCITPKEYTAACSRLLVQCKSSFKLIKSPEFETIAAFMKRFKFDCPAAMDRIKDDSPITIREDKGNTSKSIADIVANFITIMDKLKLQMKAVDEILPDMRELMDQMNNLSILPANYVGRPTVSKWLETMSTMSASSELDDEQIRQLVFDLESAYTAFQKVLHDA